MAQFNDTPPQSYRFGVGGMQVSRALELLEEHKIAYGRNIRNYKTGEIRPRPGLGTSLFNGALGTTTIHTLRRFNDPTSNAYFYIVGAGDKLYTLNESAIPGAELASGFSGLPLQLAFIRPYRSAYNWAYISDENKMVKIGPAQQLQNWSIRPLTTPLSVLLGTLNFKTISDFDSTGSWANTGTAGALSVSTRISFTIPASSILYDAGSNGWANIIPTTLDDNFQPGVSLVYNSGGGTEERALISQVFKASGSTTVKAIRYDSGSTGRCIIQLENPYDMVLEKDGTVKLTTSGGASSEFCRIIDVISSPINKPAIIVSTTLTHTTSSTCEAVRSYRTYLQNTHAAGETVAGSYMRSTVSNGTGYITLTTSLDLSTSSTPAVSPFCDRDTIHLSIRVSNPANITEIILQLDVDRATNDFTKNYYQYTIQPAALTTSATALTAAQVDLQREQILVGYRVPDNYSSYYDYDRSYGYDGNNYYSGSPGQVDYSLRSPQGAYQEPVYEYGTVSNPSGVSDAVTGSSQWTELVVRLSDFKRIGSDTSRGWKDVAALQVKVVATASVDVDIDSWYIGGTGQLNNANIGQPINYVATCYNDLTGDESLPCPPLRSGLKVNLATATITITQSLDAQVTRYKFYRIGGLLNQFTYVGSVPHKAASSTTTFIDNFPDEDVVANPPLSRDNYPVFPQLDIPRSGTATIVGNILTRTGGTDTFNTSWAAGSRITITDESTGLSFDTNLYSSPTSTTLVELEESLPFTSTTSLKWKINEPVLLGQPVRAIFGPYTSGLDLPVIFGLGCMYQAGTLFWTNKGMPGSASLSNQVEVTTPEEPLIGGFLYDTQAFVFSTERLFHITQVPTEDGSLMFQPNEVANSKGLISPSCVSVGQVAVFVGKDGIYVTTGGQPRSITDRDLYTIFPHDSQAGVASGPQNELLPLDLSLASSFHLTHHNDFFYLSYINTSAQRRILVFDVSKIISGLATTDDVGGWVSIDDYTPQVNFLYSEEGVTNPRLLAAGNDGKVYILNASTDIGGAFTWEVESRGFNLGAPDTIKTLSAVGVKAKPNGATITTRVRINNLTTTTSLGTFTGTDDDWYEVSTDTTDGDIVCDSYSIRLSGTSHATQVPTLLALSFDVELGGEVMGVAWTQRDNLGDSGAKWIQGVEVEANTNGVNKQYTIIYDDNQTGPTITLNHASRSIKPYTFTPFIAHTIRLQPLTATKIELYDMRWIWEPEPDLARNWVPQPTSFDIPGWHHIRSCFIALRSTSTVTLTIVVKGDNDSSRTYTYDIPSTSGEHLRVYLPLNSIKGTITSLSLSSSTGFRVYQKDIEFHVKPWGSNSSYGIIKPFGQISRIKGATI